MAEMSPLRRRMIEDMTVRNLSPATQRSYVHAVAKFSRYFGCSPDRLGLEDVRAFQVHRNPPRGTVLMLSSSADHFSDLRGQGRQAHLDTLTGEAFTLPIERLVLAKLPGDGLHAQALGGVCTVP